MNNYISVNPSYVANNYDFVSFNNLLLSVISGFINNVENVKKIYQLISTNMSAYNNYHNIVEKVVEACSFTNEILNYTDNINTFKSYLKFEKGNSNQLIISNIDVKTIKCTFEILIGKDKITISDGTNDSYFTSYIILLYSVFLNAIHAGRKPNITFNLNYLRSIGCNISESSSYIFIDETNSTSTTEINPSTSYKDLIKNNPGLLNNYLKYNSGIAYKAVFNSANTSAYFVMKTENSYIHEKIEDFTTISYSLHREISPISTGGKVGNNVLSYGARVFAGTIELSNPTSNNISSYLNRQYISKEFMDNTEEINENILNFIKGTNLYSDQFPPFHIYLYSIPESYHGFIMFSAIYNIRITDEGVVKSINDLAINKTWQFIASGIEPDIYIYLNNNNFEFYLSAFDKLSEIRIKDAHTPRIKF